MSQEPAYTDLPDGEKTREQLLSEIEALRAEVAVLKEAAVKSKGIEEAMPGDEGQYRLLIANFLDVTYSVRPDGTVTFVSPQIARFGYAPEELASRNFLEFVAPDCREYVLRKFRESLASGESFPTEFKWQGKDGRIYWVETLGKTLYDDAGRPLLQVGIGRNITERKRAEEALRESEEKYRNIVETAEEGIWYVDAGGNTIFVNRRMAEVLGYTVEEMMGTSVFDYMDEEYEDVARANFDVDRRGVRQKLDFRFRRRDGAGLWVIISTHPLFDDEGGYRGSLAMVTDITDRKRVEMALENAKAQAELYLDLMGHDINNMHQVALGYLELARDTLQTDEHQKEFLDKPLEILQRSARLISNVRKLQKLQMEPFQTEVVDLREVLSIVQREYEAVPQKRITLRFNGDEHCHVRANELLHDVFANLVSNAIKHTRGHADITVNLDRVEDGGNRYYRVSVEDNGPGITDDLKGVVFNRLLKSTSKAKGMGIGLYLVRSLVESYSGRVWVEDRVQGDHKKGARFVVMLPVA